MAYARKDGLAQSFLRQPCFGLSIAFFKIPHNTLLQEREYQAVRIDGRIASSALLEALRSYF